MTARSTPASVPAQDPLKAFLRARLDEDEAAAREADATVLPGDLPRETHIVYGLKDAGFGNAYQGFVLVHDPARVLRQVAAGRVTVARHSPGLTYPDECGLDSEPYPCADLVALAAVYSDHPGYRQEWACG